MKETLGTVTAVVSLISAILSLITAVFAYMPSVPAPALHSNGLTRSALPNQLNHAKVNAGDPIRSVEEIPRDEKAPPPQKAQPISIAQTDDRNFLSRFLAPRPDHDHFLFRVLKWMQLVTALLFIPIGFFYLLYDELRAFVFLFWPIGFGALAASYFFL